MLAVLFVVIIELISKLMFKRRKLINKTIIKNVSKEHFLHEIQVECVGKII